MKAALSDSKRVHSRLAPSASDRWLNCTGSIDLIGVEAERDDDNDASRAGTAAHSMLEICLKESKSPHRLVGKKAPNGTTWTDEMADGVERCLDYIRDRPPQANEKRFVEAELHIPVIDDNGHIDVGFASKAVIESIDYKNGRGYVSEVENSQMRLYGLGIYHKLSAEERRHIREYHGTISQPNAGNGLPRTEKLPITKLLAWEKEVAQKVKAIREGRGVLKAGDHCDWCPAAGRCPELAKAAVTAAGEDFEAFLDPMIVHVPAGLGKLTDKQVKTAWGRLPMIRIWMEAISKTVWNIVAEGKGEAIGMKFVEGKSNRRWKDEARAKAALLKLLIAEDVEIISIIGVPAAEKLLKKDFVKLKAHVEKPKGNPTLAPLDDARPAIRASALQDFADHL